jgi:FkbM family methyltransferase
MNVQRGAPPDFLAGALHLARPLSIADVGSNPLSPPPYRALLDANKCVVIGFEPQPAEFERLQAARGAHEQYFPHAIGDGSDIDLNVYRGSGLTSAFPICEKTVKFLQRWQRGAELVGRQRMKTTPLDQVEGLPAIDLLKIDIQGGELAAFRHARGVLTRAVCVITEVSFLQLYKGGAPSFGDIHAELTSQGFILHKFLFTKAVPLPGSQDHIAPIGKARNQLVDGDAVYIKDLREPRSLDDQQLKALAILADTTFASPDLAVRCLDELVARQAIDPALPGRYAFFFADQPFVAAALRKLLWLIRGPR